MVLPIDHGETYTLGGMEFDMRQRHDHYTERTKIVLISDLLVDDFGKALYDHSL
jgi:hypothetical protein